MTDATHGRGLRVVDGGPVYVADCPNCGETVLWQDDWNDFEGHFETWDTATFIHWDCNTSIETTEDDWELTYP